MHIYIYIHMYEYKYTYVYISRKEFLHTWRPGGFRGLATLKPPMGTVRPGFVAVWESPSEGAPIYAMILDFFSSGQRDFLLVHP